MSNIDPDALVKKSAGKFKETFGNLSDAIAIHRPGLFSKLPQPVALGLKIFLIGLIVLFLAMTIYWFIAVGAVKSYVNDWAESYRKDNHTFYQEKIDVSGYPKYVKLKFIKPIFSGAHVDMSWIINADEMDITLNPWSMKRVKVKINGVDFAGNILGSTRHNSNLKMDSVSGIIDITSHEPLQWAARLDLNNLKTRGVSYFEDFESPLTTLLINKPSVKKGNSGWLDFNLLLKGQSTTQIKRPSPIGINFIGTIYGTIFRGKLMDAFIKWRDHNGTIAMDKFYLRWGPLAMNAQTPFNLTFDSEMQLQGQGTFEITNPRQMAGFVQYLEKKGYINEEEAEERQKKILETNESKGSRLMSISKRNILMNKTKIAPTPGFSDED